MTLVDSLHRVVLASLIATLGGTAIADEPHEPLLSDSLETGDTVPVGWEQGANLNGVEYIYDRNAASDGNRSLSIRKTAQRYFPIAAWWRRLDHTGDAPAVQLSAQVKAENVTKVVLDFTFRGAGKNDLGHAWVTYLIPDSPEEPITHDWKLYEGTVAIPKDAAEIIVGLQMYGPGQVWFDEVEVRYADEVPSKSPTDSAGTDKSMKDQGSSDEQPVEFEVATDSGEPSRYLLIPTDEGTEKPEDGHPLVIVMPGGDGSADFHPFVRFISDTVLHGKFIVAQPLAPSWIVWPTRASIDRMMTTEDTLKAVIEDIASRHDIDKSRVYAVCWSSSGPAVYASLLQKDSPLAGALIAMSVFKPDQLPPLENAAGRKVYLLHSTSDRVCPFWMAEKARDQLQNAGVGVRLETYDGGHGWQSGSVSHIGKALEWLDGKAPAP
ncbi:alpha/beta hydrolase [Rubinisphaera margarita]|uniref:alpha/beta hydrolase n=1 Tax=Rubinisphaera margarita TaxID=2909586 RepID=UPI001EE8181A|nr:hypothetical protein [Rubinisphaera margarita]MCG6155502.1 hypothetical protein [Rubinisphaera margarita]